MKFLGWNILMKGGITQTPNRFEADLKGVFENYALYLQNEGSLLRAHPLYTW